MSYRSSPAFAIGGVEPKFECFVCGVETASMPRLEPRAMCCKCAGEHVEYESGYCVHCGEEQEYPVFDDDVGFGPFVGLSGPFGIPASAMNGNAADRHNHPGAWENWVAFCNANGHP